MIPGICHSVEQNVTDRTSKSLLDVLQCKKLRQKRLTYKTRQHFKKSVNNCSDIFLLTDS